LFNLRPQGEHSVCICRGTACHTRGSRTLLERVKLQLGLRGDGDDEGSADKVSATTADRKFTLRTVACFGQCALAPVVEVDHNILGHVNERALEREINVLRRIAMKRIDDLSSFHAAREAGLAKLLPSVPRIAVGMGTCGTAMAPKPFTTPFRIRFRAADWATGWSGRAVLEPARRSRW